MGILIGQIILLRMIINFNSHHGRLAILAYMRSYQCIFCGNKIQLGKFHNKLTLSIDPYYIPVYYDAMVNSVLTILVWYHILSVVEIGHGIQMIRNGEGIIQW